MKKGHRSCSAMELKYWTFKKGEEKKHLPKLGESKSTECTLILKGQVRGKIDGETIRLSAGEYVLIIPNTRSNLIEEVVKEPVVGITIKAPSRPNSPARSSNKTSRTRA
jgi:quercetin dioxygenase-like cupin family protein